MHFILLLWLCVLFSAVFSGNNQNISSNSTTHSNGINDQSHPSSINHIENTASNNTFRPANCNENGSFFESNNHDFIPRTSRSPPHQLDTAEISSAYCAFKKYLVTVAVLIKTDMMHILNRVVNEEDLQFQFIESQKKAAVVIDDFLIVISKFLEVRGVLNLELFHTLEDNLLDVLQHFNENHCYAVDMSNLTIEKFSLLDSDALSGLLKCYLNNAIISLSNIQMFISFVYQKYESLPDILYIANFINECNSSFQNISAHLFPCPSGSLDIGRNIFQVENRTATCGNLDKGNRNNQDLQYGCINEYTTSTQSTSVDSLSSFYSRERSKSQKRNHENENESQENYKLQMSKQQSCYNSSSSHNTPSLNVKSVPSITTFSTINTCDNCNRPISTKGKRVYSFSRGFGFLDVLYITTVKFYGKDYKNVRLNQGSNNFTDVCFLRYLLHILRCHETDIANWTDSLFAYGSLLLDCIVALKEEHRPIIYAFSGHQGAFNSYNRELSFLFLALFNYADKIEKNVDLSHLQKYIQNSLNSLLMLLKGKELPTGWESFKQRFNLNLDISKRSKPTASHQKSYSANVDFTILNFIYVQRRESIIGKTFFNELWNLLTDTTELNSEYQQESKNSKTTPNALPIKSTGMAYSSNYGAPLQKELTKIFQHQLMSVIDRVLAYNLDPVVELNTLFKDFEGHIASVDMQFFNVKYLAKYKLILENLAGISERYYNPDAFNYCIQSLWKSYNFQYKNFIYKMGSITISQKEGSTQYLKANESLLRICRPNAVFSKFNVLLEFRSKELFQIDLNQFETLLSLQTFDQDEILDCTHYFILQLLVKDSSCQEMMKILSILLSRTLNVFYPKGLLFKLTFNATYPLLFFNKIHSLLNGASSKKMNRAEVLALTTTLRKNHKDLGIYEYFTDRSFLKTLQNNEKLDTNDNIQRDVVLKDTEENAVQFLSYLMDYLILTESL